MGRLSSGQVLQHHNGIVDALCVFLERIVELGILDLDAACLELLYKRIGDEYPIEYEVIGNVKKECTVVAGLAKDQHASILRMEAIGELAILEAVLAVGVHLIVLVVELGVVVNKAIHGSEGWSFIVYPITEAEERHSPVVAFF